MSRSHCLRVIGTRDEKLVNETAPPLTQSFSDRLLLAMGAAESDVCSVVRKGIQTFSVQPDIFVALLA